MTPSVELRRCIYSATHQELREILANSKGNTVTLTESASDIAIPCCTEAADKVDGLLSTLTTSLPTMTELRSFGWTGTLNPQGVIHDQEPKRPRRFQMILYPEPVGDKALLLVREVRSKAREIQLAGLYVVLGRLIEGEAADILTWYAEELPESERSETVEQVIAWMQTIE